MADVFVGLGSNLGDRSANLRFALRSLQDISGIRIRSQSSYRLTRPVGGPCQPDFLNGVVRIETSFDPHVLLNLFHRVENMRGRRRGVLNGPRTLDLDLLWHDGLRIQSETLSVPHPRLHKRRFVLEPLSELAPGLMLQGKSAQECLEALPPESAN